MDAVIGEEGVAALHHVWFRVHERVRMKSTQEISPANRTRPSGANTPFTPPLPSSIVPGMSKPVKAAGPETPAAAELSFEEALKKLGSIVQAMENDDLPLEKLLTQYEEGMRMYQTCQTRLATAELRIQQIERDAAGRIQARPLDIAPTNPEL